MSFSRFLSILLIFIIFIYSVNNAAPKQQRLLRIINKSAQTIWIGTLGQNMKPENGGFELAKGKSKDTHVPTDWTAGRIWARTGCKNTNGKFVCATGDCDGKLNCLVSGTPPASLAEFTLSAAIDYYDISLVDGYNLPISIKAINSTPVNNPSLGKYNCGAPKCRFNMKLCPDELLYKKKYCSSICTAMNDPKNVKNSAFFKNFNKSLVCCECDCGPGCGCGDPKCKFGCSPLDTNPAHSKSQCHNDKWPKSSNGKAYYDIFESQCPDSYSWAFADRSSTFQCTNSDYEITFG